jgi:hypothetical protein
MDVAFCRHDHIRLNFPVCVTDLIGLVFIKRFTVQMLESDAN